MLTLPAIDSLERTPGGLRLRFSLRADLEYFAGHFPEVPMLPGVVQIGWAVELARLHLADTAPGVMERFRSLATVKFMRVIQPGASVSLSLAVDRERRELEFEFREGDIACSSGCVQFH